MFSLLENILGVHTALVILNFQSKYLPSSFQSKQAGPGPWLQFFYQVLGKVFFKKCDLGSRVT